ncbi:hypothetical protein CDO73_23415 [Saccharibacillus sp. O23]|uniref:hypothetical protein n=1 Tax=Saccharibacillus sp. O23 TaxID=2009338 RepID=UPI000B4E3231|nr:hypothetical protein [Saccharibacillus sp. O23]OWR27199.1 hypothetical protein CDO73_23415 [Saccharibacillus sp. O23]
MIAIQTILLRWSKETRGEPYASPRSRHPKAYALPVPQELRPRGGEPAPERTESGGILLHRLAFRQTTEGFLPLQNEALRLSMPETGRPVDERLLAGVLTDLRGDRLRVRLRYVPEFGKPVRTNGRSELLEQTAFELSAGEYGRVTINGRHAWEDGHVYELRTINIAFGDEIQIPADLFERKEPDKRREWLESLW